jgi:hypothetical protein
LSRRPQLKRVLGGPNVASMSEPQARRNIAAAWRRFAFLYLTLVALAVAVGFVFSDNLYSWWLERVEGPALQEEFGFTVERQLPQGGSPQDWRLVVVSVVEGGRFSRAGVRPNDAIACLYHGSGDFWSTLQEAHDGREATIRVLQPSELPKGCDGARLIHLSP